MSIAERIKSTDDSFGPTEFDWTNAEYGAFVIQSGPSSFGAYSGTIYSEGLLGRSRLPAPVAGTVVSGIVHNHPDQISGTEAGDLDQRYPSAGDWDALDRLFERFGGNDANHNPSLWIVDRWGVVRKFRRSERLYFESLSPEARQAGEGLAGKDRTTACNAN